MHFINKVMVLGLIAGLPAMAFSQTQPTTPNSSVIQSSPNSTVQPTTPSNSPNSSIPASPNSTVSPDRPAGSNTTTPVYQSQDPVNTQQNSSSPSNSYH